MPFFLPHKLTIPSAQHLRSMDRAVHVSCHPKLFYPDIYILKGGYKEFFTLFKVCFFLSRPEPWLNALPPSDEMQSTSLSSHGLLRTRGGAL